MPALPNNESAEEVKCKDLEKVAVGVGPEKFFQVGSKLPPQEKEELIGFLRENTDVFAWDAYEAPGVDPSFICHNLNVNPSVTPKKQPLRRPLKKHANRRPPPDEILGYLSRIPSNTTGHRRLRKDSFCHSYWKLPLQGDAFWFEERKVHLRSEERRVGKEC